jgi:CRP-like cAMP-binding protein
MAQWSVMKLRRSASDPVVIALEGAGLEPEVARRLAVAGTPMRVEAGVELCREGDFGREAFVLVSGEAVVRYRGTERALLVGEVFGELAVLNPTRVRNATVETTEPSTVLVFDVRTFRHLAEEISDVLAPERAA